MLHLNVDEDGIIRLGGRFDASQEAKAVAFFDQIDTTRTVDFSALEYIASAGLSVLLTVQQRLDEDGHGLRLVNLGDHIGDIFRYSGLDKIFEIS